MGDAEVHVLGPVEVVADGAAIPLAGKQVRLLSVLLIADRACGVDELVEAVWDGDAPASARKLIQVYVSQLRQALPRGIEITTRRGAYEASLPSEARDAARFERLLREAVVAREAGNAALALSLADRALSLWRGRAYGDLAYEDFARAESDRLEELRLVAVEERLAAQLELGRHEEVLGDLLAHAEGNALRERAHELAMLALYRSGRQAVALEHYAAFRASLDEELGLEPGQPLRELQRRILQQDPGLDVAAGAATSVALPIPPNPLVGRERELEALHALLDRRESRLIVLTGAGGSGKTRLALEVARQVAGSYANGVVLVELAPLRDPELVLPTIAQALEVGIDADEDALEALAGALRSQELLLLLDNAEHVRASAPAYAELVARAPRVTMLITSRAVLHVSGEHVFPVGPLKEDAAIELFAQRAHLLEAAFELGPENELDVRDICLRVDGLPLAIELAAARVRTLPPRALRERLDRRLSLLTGGPRDLPARQQTLRETIEWSVSLLDVDDREVLARLAVFPGGASLGAAESVCGATVDILGSLVDDHLIEREQASPEPRFRMLETIREYALELLGEDRARVEAAMANHLANLLDAVELEARTSTDALTILDPEIDNVRAALDACAATGNSELELRLAGSLWRYCWVRGIAAEGLRRIESALSRGGEGATLARARALPGGAGLAWSLGDWERAKALAHEAIPVAADVGSVWDEMAANTVLGIVANNEDERAAARRYHRRSMELSEQAGLEPFAQKLNLGVLALDEGEVEEARSLFEDVLAYHRRTENVSGIGFALINLGVVHHVVGDHEASLRAFQEAHDRFEEVGFRVQVARAVQGLAAYEASAGRYEEAARLLGKARGELDDVGSTETEFAAEIVAWTKQQVREGIGDEAFEAAYAAGRDVV